MREDFPSKRSFDPPFGNFPSRPGELDPLLRGVAAEEERFERGDFPSVSPLGSVVFTSIKNAGLEEAFFWLSISSFGVILLGERIVMVTGSSSGSIPQAVFVVKEAKPDKKAINIFFIFLHPCYFV